MPNSTDSTTRTRRWPKRLSISLVTLLLCIGLGEVLVRVVIAAPPPLYRRHPVLEGIYTAGFKGEVFDAESNRDVYLRINRLGYRGPEWDVEKPDGRVRVVLLGDSMIAGTAVEEELTVAGVLQDGLRERHPEVDWEVMNFAIGGGSLGRVIVHYREMVRQFSPDYVLFGFFNGNDFVNNDPRYNNSGKTIGFELDEAGELYPLPFPSTRFRVSMWLNRYSHFYRWQKGAMRRVPLNLRPRIDYLMPGYMVFANEPTGPDAHAWRLIEELTLELAGEVRADGAQFLFFTVPYAPQVYTDLWQQQLALMPAIDGGYSAEYPEARFASFCEREELRFASPLAAFQAAAPAHLATETDEQLFIAGVAHFNAQGHAVLADFLLEQLVGTRGLARPLTQR